MLRLAIKHAAQKSNAASHRPCSSARLPSCISLSTVAYYTSYGTTTDGDNPLHTSNYVALQYPPPVQNPNRTKLKDPGNSERRNLVSSDETLSLHRNVLQTLQKSQPFELLQAVLLASENPDYLRMLRATTMAEILRVLDPIYFLGPFKSAYLDLGEDSSLIHYYSDEIRPLSNIFAQYEKPIQLLLSRWRDSRRKFGLVEYKVLLSYARVMGNGDRAKDLYRAMLADGIQPDTTCYNYFLEARCWSSTQTNPEKWRLRVIHRNLKPRQRDSMHDEKRTLLRGFHVGAGGIREETMQTFTTMQKRGLEVDVNTYSALILALGREGDMKRIYKILQNEWDVDVDTAVNGEDIDLNYNHDMPSSSPLYPNQNLLFTIAHVFGANNQLPTALRVVDVFSRKFGIPINLETWNQLFQWTFVLSSMRSQSHRQYGGDNGELSLESVENLWNTMISEPYNIKPSMPMYNRYVKNMARRTKLRKVLELMRAGKDLHKAQARRTQDLLEEDKKAERLVAMQEEDEKTRRLAAKDEGVKGAERAAAKKGKSRSKLQAITIVTEKQQMVEIEYLKHSRDVLMIGRWVRLVLGEACWFGTSKAMRLRFATTEIPKIVEEFWNYQPAEGFTYLAVSCGIQIHRKSFQMDVTVSDSPISGSVIVQATNHCTEPLSAGRGHRGKVLVKQTSNATTRTYRRVKLKVDPGQRARMARWNSSTYRLKRSRRPAVFVDEHSSFDGLIIPK